MTIAIIGGSGLDQLHGIAEQTAVNTTTPFGEASPGVSQFFCRGVPTFFLPRHGDQHQFAPHQVNYRANLWLLQSLGVTKILAINVVGGIAEAMSPGSLLVPHQIVDYTWGREQTFFDGSNDNFPGVEHIDFTSPFSEALRERILAFLNHGAINHINYGTYGCTQGPRLETAAEINRLEKDGCDVVGMTAMPEAALARELEVDYAALSLVVNWAAGVTEDVISMEVIMELITTEMAHLCDFLPDLIEFIAIDH